MTRPTESGWYEVIWEPGDFPQTVFLTVNNDGSIVWGTDEEDDPEAIEIDIADPSKIVFVKLPDKPLGP